MIRKEIEEATQEFMKQKHVLNKSIRVKNCVSCSYLWLIGPSCTKIINRNI